MLLPEHTYIKPDSLAEALRALKDGGESAQVVAGGTDVIFNMRLKLFRPERVISVRRLAELAGVEELAGGGLRIGAASRLTDLLKDPRIQARYPALHDSIADLASRHIRNMGTLGGNICLQTRCWYTNNSEQWRRGWSGCYKTDGQLCHVIKSADSCHAINNADTPVALIALGAVLTIQRDGASRELPIAEFYRPDGIHNLALEADELVTHVTLPAVTDRTVFLKIAPRKGMDFSLGAIAARADGSGDKAGRVTLVLGSLSTAPIVLDRPARIAEAEGLSDAAIERAAAAVRGELGEVTNLYGRAIYKKHLGRVLVQRALRALREQ